MILFRKKEKKEADKPLPPTKTLQEIVQDRVLTAEGWRRRMLKKAKKTAKS